MTLVSDEPMTNDDCGNRDESYGRVEHCGRPKGHAGPHRNLYSLWSWPNSDNHEGNPR